MRALSKIGVGAAALLLLTVAAQPVHAACGSPYGINHNGEYVVSNPNWPAGAYYSYDQPAISPNMSVVFWALTGGNPALGAGADSGSSNLIFPRNASDLGGSYSLTALLNSIDPGTPLLWGAAAVDGCIDTTGTDGVGWDANQCTCLLLQDEWNGKGYYALISAFTDANRNYQTQTLDADLGILGGAQNDIVLSAIPKPRIQTSTRDGVNVTALVTLEGPPAADVVDPCGCLQGYRVYGTVQPLNAMPPSSRDRSQWTVLSAVGGGPQDAAPLTGMANVQAACGGGQQLFITTGLAFDSGFGDVVSENSTRIICDPTVADPQRPDRPGTRPDLPDSRPRPPGEARGR